MRTSQAGKTLLQFVLTAAIGASAGLAGWIYLETPPEAAPPPEVAFAVEAEMGDLACDLASDGQLVCAIPLRYMIEHNIDSEREMVLECSMTVQYADGQNRMAHHTAHNRFPIRPADYLLERRMFFTFSLPVRTKMMPATGMHRCFALKL